MPFVAQERKHEKVGFEGPSHFMIRAQGPTTGFHGLYIKVNGCKTTELNRAAANAIVEAMNSSEALK